MYTGKRPFPLSLGFDMQRGQTALGAEVSVVFTMDPAGSVAGTIELEASAWH